jgi:HSP20 family protein
MVNRFLTQPLGWPDWSHDWMPAVDVEETEDAWIFAAELPDVRRDDIRVEVSATELLIGGTIGDRDRVGVVGRHGRRSGSFEYRATLPAGIDIDRVAARFGNGLLKVRVPRPERAKPRRIKIN